MDNKVVIAYKKGYRVTECGDILSPRGVKMKPYKNPRGYYKISVTYYGRVVEVYIHRLQAFQKFGLKMFDDGMLVRHKNGDALDNNFDNILIGTHSDNMMDVPEQIRLSKALHATSFVKKTNKDKVRQFHEKNGRSYEKTMKEFSITSKGTLHFMLNGRK